MTDAGIYKITIFKQIVQIPTVNATYLVWITIGDACNTSTSAAYSLPSDMNVSYTLYSGP